MTEIEFKYIQAKENTLADTNSVKSYLLLAYS